MIKTRERGIICDLDGTLYKNDDLQEEFVKAFINFVSIGLGISFERAKKTIGDARISLEHRNGFPASEIWMLNEIGLDITEWFDYSEQVVKPEKYLHTDFSLREALIQGRRILWFDVTTNSSDRLAKRILKCLGIKDEIDGLWTATTKIGRCAGKPCLELYNHIAVTRHLPQSRFLVIGDRWYIDLIGVESIGMKARLVKGPEEVRKSILEYAFGQIP